MGAGKTTFTRALLEGLGVKQPAEGSPSFAIAHEYAGPRFEVIHIDFYRIKHAAEIEEAGIEAYFWERPRAVVIAEWTSLWHELERAVMASKGEAARAIWRVELAFAALGGEPPSPGEGRDLRITRLS
jgi:tRNA threonylcarbamoyladenosine biosynthesis protein TsaE